MLKKSQAHQRNYKPPLIKEVTGGTTHCLGQIERKQGRKLSFWINNKVSGRGCQAEPAITTPKWAEEAYGYQAVKWGLETSGGVTGKQPHTCPVSPCQSSFWSDRWKAWPEPRESWPGKPRTYWGHGQGAHKRKGAKRRAGKTIAGGSRGGREVPTTWYTWDRCQYTAIEGSFGLTIFFCS